MRALPPFAVGDRLLIDGELHEYRGCFEEKGSAPDAPYSLKFETVPSGAPVPMTDTQFQAAYCDRRVRWLKPYEHATDAAPETDDNDHPKARLRRLYCQAFDASPCAKSTTALEAFVKGTAPTIGFAHKPPSPGALRVWLRQRGATGDRRPRFMRDRIRRGPGAMRIDPIAQKVLAEQCEAYWGGLQMNQHLVYCATRAALISINESRRETGLPAIKAPSGATVHRYIRQHADYQHSRRRYGEKVGGRPYRPIKGSMKVERILQIAIMDHTPIDIGVVDEELFYPVGRPWLTMLIDACSRAPLGIHLGFEPPSVSSVMACLRHAVRPKLEVRAQYPDIQGEWIFYGVPDTIVVDNGWEFRSSSFVDACADANINVTYAAIASPEYKSIGERAFGTLRQKLFERLPGGLPLTPQKRKEIGIDPVRDAVLTLSELKHLLYQFIIEVYSKEYHKGIKAAPEQVWRKQVSKHGNYALDLASLDQGLSRLAADHVLSRDGIEMFDLTYRAVEPLAGLLADLLPHRKRGERWGTRTVKVKFHPEDLGEIYVWNHVKKTYVTLPCTQPSYAKGLSQHQHKRVQDHAKAEYLAFRSEDERCLARMRLHESVRTKIPGQSIGDRLRAQRLLPGPNPLSPGDQVLVTEANATQHAIPMATVAGRKGEAKPRRAPLYEKGKRRHAASRAHDEAATPPRPSSVLTVPDAFGEIDFSEVREEARQLLDCGGPT